MTVDNDTTTHLREKLRSAIEYTTPKKEDSLLIQDENISAISTFSNYSSIYNRIFKYVQHSDSQNFKNLLDTYSKRSSGLSCLAFPSETEYLKLLSSNGLKKQKKFIVYELEISDYSIPESNYRVEELQPGKAREFINTVLRSRQQTLQHEEVFIDFQSKLIEALIQQPNCPYKYYTAWDGEKMIGAAKTFVQEDFYWIKYSAILEEYRDKGVFKCLFARQRQDCKDCGTLKAYSIYPEGVLNTFFKRLNFNPVSHFHFYTY